MRVEHQISLSPFTTFGVEARAKRLVRLESREDLEALRTVREKDEPLLIIGAGSNILFTKDFDGLVALNRITGVEDFLIDRVTAIAGNKGVESILCVNKTDLDRAEELVRVYTHAGFRVISTSAETGAGLEELRQAIQGKLTAFTGNSGVGKSSILNRLCPNLALPTGEVSEKLGRGRHTTRHVELFPLDAETFVMDTPGFSSFDTDQMDIILKENLQYAFPDFGPFLGRCQFQDCAHRREPGCAVRRAVESGEIEPTRYDSYLRLYEKAAQYKEWEHK